MKFLNKSINLKNESKNRGLTIVESLVAISILVVSVLGPLVIVSQAFKISFFARDQITALYLAQEGIEFVRNLKDKNSLTQDDPANWLAGIISGPFDPVINDIDVVAPVKYQLTRSGSTMSLVLCPGTPSVCPRVRYDPTTGVYGNTSGGRNSIYTREIIFVKSPDDDTAEQEVTVKVVMRWNQVGGTYELPVHVQMTNWKIQNYLES